MIHSTFTSVSTGMQVLLYSPKEGADDGRVILYLHGAGGFGSGIAVLYEFRELPTLLKEGLQLTSSVLIPSCHIGEYWQSSIVLGLLDDYEKGYCRSNVRYDLLGFSRGGAGALGFAATYPTLVRSITVVSARSAPSLVSRIAKIPVLICHGINDQKIPVSEAKLMYEELHAAGCKCEIILIEGNHFIIGYVLSGGAVFEWQKNAT